MGLKFVPHNNFNISDLYYNILKDIDQELITLNKKLILFNKPDNNNSIIPLNNNSDKNSVKNVAHVLKANPENSNIDSIITIFKKLKRKNNFHNKINFELNEDIINLRFQLLKDLPNYYNNFKSNITKKQLNTLIQFNKTKPFKIIDTDKNTGAVLISNELHIEIAKSHLNDSSTYERLLEDPTIDIFKKVEFALNELLASKNISKSIYNI